MEIFEKIYSIIRTETNTNASTQSFTAAELTPTKTKKKV